jgi:hypothetical protein
LLVELPIVLPQDMFHLRNGAKQHLAAGAHRAVVNGPSDFSITSTFEAQARVSGETERVSYWGKTDIAVACDDVGNDRERTWGTAAGLTEA